MSIPQQEGQLLEAVYDDGPVEDGFGRRIEGYMVPINCENSGARCQPSTYAERVFVKELVEGGTITLNSPGVKAADKPVEFLLAHFGTKVPQSSTELSLVMAKPSEACTPLENDVRGTHQHDLYILLSPQL